MESCRSMLSWRNPIATLFHIPQHTSDFKRMRVACLSNSSASADKSQTSNQMVVSITGATGFIGRRLVQRLVSDDHSVRVLTRSRSKAQTVFPDKEFPGIIIAEEPDWKNCIQGSNAVVNLAGLPISTRWSPEIKKEIKQSRIGVTSKVVDLINQTGDDVRPTVLVSATAIGYYGKLLMDDHPTLFWTPCAAHCIDLMLHDICKLPIITKTVKRAIALNGYIYNHPYVLNMMRTFTEQKELIRPGVTRFATVFLTLQSIHNQKNKLRRMFTSEEWSTSRYHRDTKGKDAYETVMSVGFWNNILYSLRATGPLGRVLRLVDSEKKPAMGYIYEAMDRAKEAISKSLNYNEGKYCEIWEIIDKRWNDQLHRPLHAAGYYLNPEYFYSTPRIESNEELNEGFLKTMARLVPDEAIQHRVETELSLYRYARGVMGSPNAIRNKALWSPGTSETQVFDEGSPSGNDYLAEVCREWEAKALEVNKDVRLVLIRIGVVLGKEGGALAKMIPLFMMFAGGPLGSGKQWFSWIHVDDIVNLIYESLSNSSYKGIINGTAPNPVRFAEMCEHLGEVMGRPSWLPVPDFALKAVLGEGASIVLEGQRVLPVRAKELGFSFSYSYVKDALNAVMLEGKSS